MQETEIPFSVLIQDMSEEEIQARIDAMYPVQKIGPTWQIVDDHWLVPEHTLGFQVIEWIAENLLSPTGDGTPFILTFEQSRFLLWYYALDNDGNFLYPNGILQRCKGHGKDPLGAAMCLVELIGPCRFSHWDEDGDPVGKPHPAPQVRVAAVAMEQNENTRDLFPLIIPKPTVDKYGLDVQKEIIYVLGGRGKLRVISSNARSAEGGRITFFLANEIHHWVPGNGGVKFYTTMMNNLRKGGGRFAGITNGYQPGEESVLEVIRESQRRVWDGIAAPNGWLYDSLEAHPKAPLDQQIAPYILRRVMGDSSWLVEQIPGIVQSFTDTSIPSSQQRRMWYNQIVSVEEQAFAVDEIEAIVDRKTTGTIDDLRSGDRITLGFDGSRTDDATALVAYRLSDKMVVPLAIWEKPDTVTDWHVPTDDVDSMVGMAFARYDIIAFYADVKDWESYIARWSELYRENLLVRASASNSIGYDMRGHRSDIAFLNETLIGMVREGEIKLNANSRLRTHFLNAERRWTGGHLSFGKIGGRESPRKIDALIAASLAIKAAIDFQERGKAEKPKYTRTLNQW